MILASVEPEAVMSKEEGLKLKALAADCLVTSPSSTLMVEPETPVQEKVPVADDHCRKLEPEHVVRPEP